VDVSVRCSKTHQERDSAISEAEATIQRDDAEMEQAKIEISRISDEIDQYRSTVLVSDMFLLGPNQVSIDESKVSLHVV